MKQMNDTEKELLSKFKSYIVNQLQMYSGNMKRDIGNLSAMEEAFYDKVFNHIVEKITYDIRTERFDHNEEYW